RPLLPIGLDGTNLDRPAEPCGRDARGELDRGVQIVRLEDEEPADRLLDAHERADGDERLAVLHAYSRRVLGEAEGESGGDALGLVDRAVVGVDLLLLVLRQSRPLV